MSLAKRKVKIASGNFDRDDVQKVMNATCLRYSQSGSHRNYEYKAGHYTLPIGHASAKGGEMRAGERHSVQKFLMLVGIIVFLMVISLAAFQLWVMA